MVIWPLTKTCAKYNNPFYIFLSYHQNILTQYLCQYLLIRYLWRLQIYCTQLNYQQYFWNTYYSHKYMYYDSKYNLFVREIPFSLTLTFAIIPFLIWITCCTIKLVFTITWNLFPNILISFFCYHIKYLTFMSFVSLHGGITTSITFIHNIHECKIIKFTPILLLKIY